MESWIRSSNTSGEVATVSETTLPKPRLQDPGLIALTCLGALRRNIKNVKYLEQRNSLRKYSGVWSCRSDNTGLLSQSPLVWMHEGALGLSAEKTEAQRGPIVHSRASSYMTWGGGNHGLMFPVCVSHDSSVCMYVCAMFPLYVCLCVSHDSSLYVSHVSSVYVCVSCFLCVCRHVCICVCVRLP